MKHAWIAIFVMCIISAPVHAKTEKQEEPKATPTLQLKHILAPAQTRPGSFTSTMRPMTPILVVPRDFNKPLVCQRAPRAAEALLQYFISNPAPVTKRYRLDEKALEAQKTKIAAYVNRAIGTNAVSAVYIFEGGKALSTGVAARLPGNATACGPVLEEFEKQVQELMKE